MFRKIPVKIPKAKITSVTILNLKISEVKSPNAKILKKKNFESQNPVVS